MIDILFRMRLAQLEGWTYVGPNNTPVSTKVVERLKKIHALGLDISTKQRLEALTRFMADEFLVSALLEIPDADYPAVLDAVMGKGQLPPKPTAPLGPEPDVQPEPTEEDVRGLPETYTPDQIQRMRGSLYLGSMARLAQTQLNLPPGSNLPLDDMMEVIHLLTDAGFRTNDRATTMQLLQWMKMSGSPLSNAADGLTSMIVKMNDKQYQNFVTGTHEEPTTPPAPVPSTTVTPTPSVPTAPDTAPAAQPLASEDVGGVEIALPKGVRGNATFKYMLDEYNEVIKRTPPGVTAAGLGDGIPIGVLPATAALGNNPTHAVKGGDFIRTYQPKGQEFVGMIVGYQDGRLAVRTNTGGMKLIDPIRTQARASVWKP